MAGAEAVEDASSTDLSEGDWSALECRVEEGSARVSKVLEDGTIQVRVGNPHVHPTNQIDQIPSPRYRSYGTDGYLSYVIYTT